ncbi:MAG: PPC domain-containing protein, partial [Chloroflexi bacterium]|nr:PPC domain-containing protein [Chloroflexota bacterium]
MRRFVIAIAAAGLVAAVIAPSIGAKGPGGDADRDRQFLGLGGQVAPKSTSMQGVPPGPNPYLALVPDPSKIDYAAWKRYADRQSQERADRLRAARFGAGRAVILVDEEEPAGTRGSNDSTSTAQRVSGFGSADDRQNRARIVGELSPEEIPTDARPANTEDDGSIPLAGATGIGTVRDGITTSARIGDGPHGRSGSGSGDFDFYAVDAVAGEVLVVDTATPMGRLDTMVGLFDSAGELLAFNDDSDGFDSRLESSVPLDGRYYVALTGYPVVPLDPFDSGSGEGAGSQGPYDVTITTGETDLDFYALRLRKGDVLGVSIAGAATRVAIYDRSAVEVMGSTQDATFIYSPESPMPGGGNAVAEHVAAQRGWHYVAVSSGDGDYDITVEV